ncbi:high mobility group B protein 14 isoform X2 [Nicotiana sylvestris]|uniref:High mobility group B protein 14 n=1 Tax=Nicotiana sylvestris TaxID=4096 RepID=A0A1U7XDZ1_NICSY|nr:PREDICTED: high mobility group B protein 14 [Nicotiana sylvestris]
MAKKASSTSRNSASASASASTPASTNTSVTTTKSQMVLRVRSNGKVKASGMKQSKPTSGKNLKATFKKNIAKIDAMKPKKPPTAFFYFLEDFRKEFQEQNPDVKSMRDVGKACGEKWKTMTYEEKVHYYDIATEKRREFDRAMADFNKRKESGEFQEFEEDSDFDE